jgi:hypothetical protein
MWEGCALCDGLANVGVVWVVCWSRADTCGLLGGRGGQICVVAACVWFGVRELGMSINVWRKRHVL